MASLTLHVKNENLAEFKECFLLAYPNETLETENPMSDSDWVREKIRLFVFNAYVKGKRILWKQSNQPIIDKNIVTIQ